MAAMKAVVLSFAVMLVMSMPASVAQTTVDFLTSLSDAEVGAFQEWRTSRRAYEQKLDAYWEKVDGKRAGRRKKRAAQVPFDTSDYVMTLPPTYDGPKLSPALAKKYEKFLAAQDRSDPKPTKDMATVADYLATAKRVYNFTPERVSEKEFKRRYAREAMRLGLSKDQVVRIYALETGGIGTFDMQAGIHPIKKTGRPISSALGYAQLLDANSVNELYKAGPDFVRRLEAMAANPNVTAQRRAQLKGKISAIKRMYANVRKIPYEWSRQQAYAKTPEGMGVHALNIDGDIGPLLQAIKLKGLKDTADKVGRTNLSGAEMELMNLSGPATGLEMMQPAGRKAPTTNFFARRAYYVNKMVIGLDGAGLLAELDRRMDSAVKTPGSVEFASAFDAVLAER
ncbi:MAG: hypothetical protein CTY31_01925 [Hyphomicrobium sp.]|nr:MAG: hypothetical protein CTY39_00430 [Hyphomicrobium sp.]PPD01545.1 MAG: hypothetical protein CTY31_01925 [Hyphomicrobium sp.]